MEWYVFAVLSALFAALAPIADKKSLKSLNGLEFSTVFAISNFIILIPLVFFISSNVPLEIMAVLFVGSIFGTFGFLLVMKGMKKLPISIVSPMKNFDPAILAVLAFFVLGEKFTIRQIIGVTMIVIGAYSIEVKNHDLTNPLKTFFFSNKSKLYLFILLSGILYGFSSIIDKVVLSAINPLQYILIAHAFIAFNFSVLTVIANKPDLKRISSDIGKSAKWVLAASLLTVSYRLLQAIAVSMANVSLVIPVRHLSVLFTTTIGGKLFHEKHLLHRTISALIMLVGAWLIISA
ncbi:MAG: EamA family transporter [Candidatus Aenigmarchaeota archaeon]|nr:EamA family transporter [Candidatus Aenigmarchaeota archaeon]